MTLRNARSLLVRTLAGRFKSAGRLKTHDNDRYVRNWWEVASTGETKWRFLHNGGTRAAFYGNDEEVADWSASAQHNYGEHGGMPKSEAMGRAGITWTLVGSAAGSFRLRGAEDLFSSGSPTIVCDHDDEAWAYLAALNSTVAARLLEAINPTMNTVVGNILSLPTLNAASLDALQSLAMESYRLAVERQITRETSPKFVTCAALSDGVQKSLLCDVSEEQREHAIGLADAITKSLTAIDAVVSDDWGIGCPARRSLMPPSADDWNGTLVKDLVSYAIGCMFGRYSLDDRGLILVDHSATLQDYLARVPSPMFTPDADNVIPIVDGDWFEDDIIERFRQFLRATFGEQHFEENLRFVTKSLGVKSLRDYFVKSFYKDHVQRYKKRPIYWLFSSPKGSFNALVWTCIATPQRPSRLSSTSTCASSRRSSRRALSTLSVLTTPRKPTGSARSCWSSMRTSTTFSTRSPRRTSPSTSMTV